MMHCQSYISHFKLISDVCCILKGWLSFSCVRVLVFLLQFHECMCLLSVIVQFKQRYNFHYFTDFSGHLHYLSFAIVHCCLLVSCGTVQPLILGFMLEWTRSISWSNSGNRYHHQVSFVLFSCLRSV